MSREMSFWDRRKAAVKAEANAEARKEAQIAQAEEVSGKDDAQILAEMNLPDPASMKQGDDFASFMSGKVPEHLRRQALRTLWRSNPVLACVDGLNDYDDDYGAAMLMSEPIKTAYQVGKGMKSHLDELARQAETKNGVAETEVVTETEAEALTSTQEPEVTASLEPVAADSVDVSSDAAAGQVAQDETPSPRRMQFRFEEARA